MSFGGGLLLATAVFAEALCAGLAGVWREASDWLRELATGGRSERYERAWQELAAAELVLVNGLGGVFDFEDLGARSRAELAELIDHRRVRRRPTILASRMSVSTDLRALHGTLRDLEVPLKLKVSEAG